MAISKHSTERVFALRSLVKTYVSKWCPPGHLLVEDSTPQWNLSARNNYLSRKTNICPKKQMFYWR
jgi:hypothetical protein